MARAEVTDAEFVAGARKRLDRIYELDGKEALMAAGFAYSLDVPRLLDIIDKQALRIEAVVKP